MIDSKLANLLRAKGRTESEIEQASDEFDVFYAGVEKAGEADWPAKYDELRALTAQWGFTLDELNYDENSPEWEEFDAVLDRLIGVMSLFGENGYEDDSDYWIVDDNYSVRDLLIEVSNSELDWNLIQEAIRSKFCSIFPEWSVILRFRDRDVRVESKKS